MVVYRIASLNYVSYPSDADDFALVRMKINQLVSFPVLEAV